MLRICLRLFAWMPLCVAHAIGAGVASLLVRPSSRVHQRIRENIAHAAITSEPGALDALIRKNIQETGKAVAELPVLWMRPLSHVTGLVRHVEGWDDRWVDGARGVIFLTPHLGGFEITSLWAAERLPLTVLYRPPRQRWLAPLMQAGRARGLIRTAPTSLKGVRALLKALKSGGAVGLLPDQVPPEKDGVWAEFFGRPAWTMTLPAKLQAATGARIVLVAASRLPAGKGFDLHFVSLPPLPADETAAAQTLNAALETLIRRFPEQYAWSYNRYRQPRPYNPVSGESA